MQVNIETSEATHPTTGSTVYRVTQFKGRRNTAHHYAFRTAESRDIWIQQEHAIEAKRAERKAERKAERDADLSAMRACVKVGSIFVSSWGYDQTNVNAYQVIAISQSKATVTIRPITTVGVEGTDGFMSQKVKPCPGVWADNYAPLKKRITPHGIKIDRHIARLASPDETFYSSWYA